MKVLNNPLQKYSIGSDDNKGWYLWHYSYEHKWMRKTCLLPNKYDVEYPIYNDIFYKLENVVSRSVFRFNFI